jgi:hypothetical protein
MTKVINKLYDNYSDAVAAINALESNEVSHNDISIVANNNDPMKKNNSAKIEDPTDKNATAKGAGGGAAAGAVAGGGVGLLAGLGMLAIPGVGPVVAAGWLIAAAAGAVAGATAGAAAGGVVGKLTEYEVSKEDAEFYAEAVRRGASLVSVKVSDKNVGKVEQILNQHKAVDVASRRAIYARNNWTSFDANAPAYAAAEIEAERALYR